MPSPIVKSFADKTKKSFSEIEDKWKKSTEIVDKQYPDIKKDSDKYYKLVVGILKNMIGLKENKMKRFKEYLQEGIQEDVLRKISKKILKGLRDIPFELIEHGKNKYSNNEYESSLFYKSNGLRFEIKLTYNSKKDIIQIFISDVVGKNIGVDIPANDIKTMIKAIKDTSKYKKYVNIVKG
jgi:hypothetical protein